MIINILVVNQYNVMMIRQEKLNNKGASQEIEVDAQIRARKRKENLKRLRQLKKAKDALD